MVERHEESARMAEAIPGEAGVPAPEVAAAPGAPLALLLAGHLIQDGEIVQLLLKPSMLFVPLSSLWALGVAAMIGLAPRVFTMPGSTSSYVNLAVLLAVGRLMWATLQWMGRYYILTDRRVMTLMGVFSTQVYQCPLRKVARVRVLRSLKDKALSLGTIELIPTEEEIAVGLWQTVDRPKWVRERVQQAVAKAKSGGRG
jgi:hypothetical protein